MEDCEGTKDRISRIKDLPENDSTKENKECIKGANVKSTQPNFCVRRPFMTKKCDIHHNDVEYFCPIHDKVGCDTCRQISHRNCTNTRKISEICGSVSDSKEFQKMKDEMKAIDQYCDENAAIVKSQIDGMKANYREALNQVKDVFQKLYQKDKEKLDSINETSNVIKKEIQALKEEFECKDDIQKFILMKKADLEITKFRQSLASARKDVKISHYGLIPVTTNGIGCNGRLPHKPLGQIHVFPVQLAKIEIETQSDRHYCSISGIELVLDGKVVIADNGNKKIKLFSERMKTLLAELPIEITPLVLTRIDDQTVILSSASDKLATVLNTKHGNISITSQFELDGLCQNIGVSGTKLAVSFNDSKQIVFLDTTGQVFERLEMSSILTEIYLESQPKAVTYDTINEVLYIALSGQNKIAMINSVGDVISHFEADNMKYPISIALGRNGSVYVCCRDSDNIFQLSRDLSIGHEILNEDHGLISPWCISVCTIENVLYVGSYGGKYVHIFKL